MRRVAITGIGLRSPVGNTVARLSESIVSAICGLQPWTVSTGNGDLNVLAGCVDDDFPDIPAKLLRRIDRYSAFALQSSIDAVANARLNLPLRQQAGILFGTGFGGLDTLYAQIKILEERGPKRVSPFMVPAAIANAAAGHIAERMGISGPAITYATACSSSANAIGEAFLRVRSGELDLALTGGSEAPLSTVGVAGFAAMRALAESDQTCRPFAEDRSGLCLAEGGCMLILEPLDQALERRATIYAELCGYATTTDAHHITEPDPQGKGAEKAVRLALEDAGLGAESINYINAHGTATILGDKVEAQMINRVFQSHSPWVSSTKGMTGHLLGGAGALEAAITAVAIQTGLLPPNSPVTDAADECPVRLVAHAGQQEQINYALSTSFGFGGVNVALVFGRPDLEVEPQ